MALTESQCLRSDDTGTTKDVKTYLDPDTGDHIQAIAIDDDSGDQTGISGNPLHVQGVVLTAIKTAVELIRNAISGNEMLIAGGATQATDVKVTLDSEVVPVTGTFWQATQPVEKQEVPPTDAAKNNPSFVFTYTNGDLTGIAMTIGVTTYNRTLAYTNGDLTSMTVWS